MNIKELRIGNLINYEACTCQIMAINTLNKDRLNVKAVNHEWGVELCLVEEVTPLEITPNFLKKNGFEILNKTFPELWIKPLSGYRYLRYHSRVKYLDFETTNTFQRVPWAIRYVHQLQNACTDYGIQLELKA